MYIFDFSTGLLFLWWNDRNTNYFVTKKPTKFGSVFILGLQKMSQCSSCERVQIRSRPSGGINTRRHVRFTSDPETFTDGRRTQRLEEVDLSSLLFINISLSTASDQNRIWCDSGCLFLQKFCLFTWLSFFLDSSSLNVNIFWFLSSSMTVIRVSCGQTETFSGWFVGFWKQLIY